MKQCLRATAIWGAVVVFMALGGSLYAADASITTSKPRYDVGEGMQIQGSGFTANAQISISVQRPDKIIDNVSGTFANGSGAFQASYVPPPIPGRYRITATDGVNTAITATTEADQIGYSKGVYRKAQLAYNDTTGGWVTGNAGGFYRENQWAYYQYAIQGFGSTIPDFDVEWNHYEANVNAVFIDALANFRACVDCTEDAHTTGPDAGTLLDSKPFPPTGTTFWKNAAPAISRINGEFDVPNSVCKDPSLYGTTPASHNCFHVDGAALKALFPEINFSTGTHTLTLYYQAHLASSIVWMAGKEYLLGCASDPAYVNPIPQVIPAGTVYGTETYSGGSACALDSPGDMTGSYHGVSAATGSSRNFQLVNTGLGSRGALTLPIPTVPPATGAITITKVTNPASAVGATFGFTSDLGPFNLDTDPGTATSNTTTFSGLTGGASFLFTEASLPAGWTLTNLQCTGSAGVTFTVVLGSKQATVTLPDAANSTATCTFTNTGYGAITINKNTVGGDATFAYTTTGSAPVTAFNLTTSGGAATRTFTQVAPGAYTVTESGPPTGWQFTDLVCTVANGASQSVTLATRTANLTIAAGSSAECTYVNTKQGSVTIVKNAVGGNDTFAFTATGGAPLANFNLTTVSNTAQTTFSNVPPGSYNVTESGPPAGWQFTSLQCSTGGSVVGQVASITVPAGGNVTCTFTNTMQGSVTIIKNAVGGNDTFAFTATGGAPLAGFFLTTVSNVAQLTFSNVPPGAYTVTEAGPPAGWQFTSLQCSTGGTPSGQAASINLPPGGSVTCTYVNSKLPTLKILKYSDGGPETFTYTVTGPTALSPSITTVGSPTGTGSYGPQLIAAGGPYNVSENTPPVGWTMTDISCTLGSGGPDTNADLIPDSWQFIAGYGDNVVCTFVNNKINTTRTQGFWSTHTGLANLVWNSGLNGGPAVIGTADAKLCTANDITATTATGTNQLMGGFWSNVAQRTENPRKRSELDHARMQMLQQYFAAVLNHHAFGSGSDAMLADARTAYCTGTADQVRAQVGILGSFNESGDGLPFTPGASATAQLSKSQANIPFWDTTSR